MNSSQKLYLSKFVEIFGMKFQRKLNGKTLGETEDEKRERIERETSARIAGAKDFYDYIVISNSVLNKKYGCKELKDMTSAEVYEVYHDAVGRYGQETPEVVSLYKEILENSQIQDSISQTKKLRDAANNFGKSDDIETDCELDDSTIDSDEGTNANLYDTLIANFENQYSEFLDRVPGAPVSSQKAAAMFKSEQINLQMQRLYNRYVKMYEKAYGEEAYSLSEKKQAELRTKAEAAEAAYVEFLEQVQQGAI